MPAGLPPVPVIVSAGRRDGAEPFSRLLATRPGATLAAASAAVEPDSVAKILFTSGSTGVPKGVLNTHRMLAANQQMIRQVWPFLTAEPPVIVDWLPWSHTFGGNHNLNMVLTNGGTVYIDAGRPVPALFGQTVRNLADVPPTVYFNVPAGYAQLVPALEADPAFAERFFGRLRLMFNAAAALPAGLDGLTNPDEPGSGGTLLAVVPIPGTDSSLAIVGYTVPAGVARDRVQAPRRADGGLVVDHARRCVWLGGREVQLTYQEFELLAFLSANPAQVFSRADLLAQVWGQQQNTRHHTRTVDVHVSRLRRKLGPVFGQCLTTEHRVGYRFDPTMDVSV